MSGTTKNIVNVQNNKLDFYLNDDNRFDISLRGDVKFTVSEDTNVLSAGAQIRAVGHGISSIQDETANFVGRISNIDNHSISNLSDVNIGSIADGNLLQWVDSLPGFQAIDVNAVGATSLLFAVGGTNKTLDIVTERIKFSGTDDKISVTYLPDSTNIVFSLPSTVNLGSGSNFEAGIGKFNNYIEAASLIVTGTSSFGGNVVIDGSLTVNGTQTIINTEVKLIEDSLITLGYEDGGGATLGDIGFRGKYQENTDSTNSALFFYDISNNDFVVMDKYYDSGENITEPDDIDRTKGEYANFLAGGIRLVKSQSTRALADVSLYNLSHTTTVAHNNVLLIPATNIIDCSNLENSTAVLSGLLNITAWKDNLSSWAQNISNYSIIHKGSGDITVNFMTVFELNSNFSSFDLSTNDLTICETNGGSYTVETRVLPLGHKII